MKVYVGDQEIEIQGSGKAVFSGDRFLVRTSEGVFSGVRVQSRGKLYISFRGQTLELGLSPPAKQPSGQSVGSLNAVMPGVIIALFAIEGENVEQGQKIGILEAMKTQQPIFAPYAGVLVKVLVQEGQQVFQDQPLFEITSVETEA